MVISKTFQPQYQAHLVKSFPQMPGFIFLGLSIDGKYFLQLLTNEMNIDVNDPHMSPINDILYHEWQGMKVIFTCCKEEIRAFVLQDKNVNRMETH